MKKSKSKSTKRPKRVVRKSQPRKNVKKGIVLNKSLENPILVPNRENSWESWQTFNPAAVYENGKVHLLYRAIGEDGISVVGYASSRDGIHVDERLPRPVYLAHKPNIRASDIPYSSSPYISGGGFGGCEDPRVTKIDDRIYMIYVAFDGAHSPGLALTHISLEDFLKKRWKWGGVKIISAPGVIDKSGCLFPEKIKGKYVVLHRIFPNILIDFVDDLHFKKPLAGEFVIKVRKGYWDSRKIGAGAPPIKTDRGWLLLYYAVDNRDASRYKIGAMLLDLKNPTKVLYRTDQPVLEPVEWYENEGHKSGIAYPCGAAVIDGTLFVYYGGADTVVCVATADLQEFLEALVQKRKPKLTKVSNGTR